MLRDIASPSLGGVHMSIEAKPSHYWEQRAGEARARAETMISDEAKELIRDVARLYRRMATIASKRNGDKGTRFHPFMSALPRN
jgi:hypothetical protein